MPTNNDAAALGWVSRAYRKIQQAHDEARKGDTDKVSELLRQVEGHMQDAFTFVNSGYTSVRTGERIVREWEKVSKASHKAISLAEKVKAEREAARNHQRG